MLRAYTVQNYAFRMQSAAFFKSRDRILDQFYPFQSYTNPFDDLCFSCPDNFTFIFLLLRGLSFQVLPEFTVLRLISNWVTNIYIYTYLGNVYTLYVPFVEVLSSLRLYTCTQLITGQTCLGKVTIVGDWYTRIGKHHFVKSFILQNGCNDGLWTYSKCGSESGWLLQK